MSKIKTRDKLLDAGYIEIYKHGYQGYLVLRVYASSISLSSKIIINKSTLYE